LDYRPEFLVLGVKREWDKATSAGSLEACLIEGFFGLATKENIFLLRICF